MSLDQLIQDTIDRTVRSTIAQLEEAGWTPPAEETEDYEVSEARRVFTQAAMQRPISMRSIPEGPGAWNARMKRLGVQPLLDWLNGKAEAPENLLELKAMMHGAEGITEDLLALHYVLNKHYTPRPVGVR